MIIEYLRPDTIEEAIDLLNRQNPKSIPLGGGTSLAQMRSGDATAVIDLQALGMRKIEIKNDFLEIGANVTLQQLHDYSQVPPLFKQLLPGRAISIYAKWQLLGGQSPRQVVGHPSMHFFRLVMRKSFGNQD